MSAHQQMVGAGAAGLIIANAWTGPQRAQLGGLLGGTGSTTDAHTALKHLGVETVAAGVLVILAGGSSQGAGAAAAVLAILWLVWWMRRTPATRTSAPGPPHSGVVSPFHSTAT